MFLKILNEIYLFIFFACPKKTNQKKRQPYTCPAFSGIPCAAHKKQTPRKVAPPSAVLRRVAFQLFIPLLGCVKWHLEKTTTLLK